LVNDFILSRLKIFSLLKTFSLQPIFNKRRRGKLTESKKEWVTPELIVLVRSKPEEAGFTDPAAVCKGYELPSAI